MNRSTRHRPSIQTTELREVSRRLGELLIARYQQEGGFRVRQAELLRRSLQDAAQALNWDVLASHENDPVQEVAVDVERLTQAGMRAIEKDLESEIAEKRG
jgi:hypothetical protein